jgi:hypothetical protein
MRFGGRFAPPIVPTVFVSDGRLGELLVHRVVQASDVDGVELAAEFFHVSATARFHAAAATEEVVYGVGAELVVRQNILSPQQPKRVGFDEGFPEPRLGADRTVALAGASLAIGQLRLRPLLGRVW